MKAAPLSDLAGVAPFSCLCSKSKQKHKLNAYLHALGLGLQPGAVVALMWQALTCTHQGNACGADLPTGQMGCLIGPDACSWDLLNPCLPGSLSCRELPHPALSMLLQPTAAAQLSCHEQELPYDSIGRRCLLTSVQLQNPACHIVQEVAIVGDCHHGAGEVCRGSSHVSG